MAWGTGSRSAPRAIRVAGQRSVRITRHDAGRAGPQCSHLANTGCHRERTVHLPLRAALL